ncbi:MAG: hypothetical protein AB7E49_03410 [Campylobacterales bacterium]
MTATIDLTGFRAELQTMIRTELAKILGSVGKQGAEETIPLKEAAARYGVSEAWLRKTKKEHPNAFGHAGTKLLVRTREFEKLIAG